MIVTLDSGIFISAFKYGGVPEEVLAYVVANDELLICYEIEDEVVRVMRDKFHRSPEEVGRLLLARISHERQEGDVFC